MSKSSIYKVLEMIESIQEENRNNGVNESGDLEHLKESIKESFPADYGNFYDEKEIPPGGYWKGAN